jgi:hypothetical protein
MLQHQHAPHGGWLLLQELLLPALWTAPCC